MTSSRENAAIIAALVITAIAIVTALALSRSATDDQAGPGLPVQLPNDEYAGDAIVLTAPLVLGSEGCFRLGTPEGERFVIWPRGFTSGGDVVIDSEGERLEAGDPLAVAGLEMAYDDLVAIEGPDGYWASVAGFCIRDDDTVLVLDDVALAG